MGLLAGSSAFVRFTVQGAPPEEQFWDFIAERVVANSFKDIDDTMDEHSMGWVSVANMFDADFAFSSYAAGNYVVLSMRIDERKVSPAVLKKFTAKEEERIKREKQLPRLARSVRMEIKERIRAELLYKSPPVPLVYDMYWNSMDNTVVFFSTNRKAISLFEDLFKASFDLSLILQVPWLMGLQGLSDADDGAKARFEDLRPALLV